MGKSGGSKILGKFRKQTVLCRWSLGLGVRGRKERSKARGGLWPIGQNKDPGVPLRNVDFIRQCVGVTKRF